MKGQLRKYCDKKKITMEKLSTITGVPFSTLNAINSDYRRNITVRTVVKIYKGTKKKFGKGLNANEYLDVENGI